MNSVQRPRRYVPRAWLLLLRPAFRYSQARDAYVLRMVGRRRGPVLKVDRRRGHFEYRGPDRRGQFMRRRVPG